MAIPAVLTRHKTLSFFLLFLHLAFIGSFILSWRAVTSMSVGLILLAGLIQNKAAFRSAFSDRAKNLFIVSCSLFFLLQVIALAYTQHQQQGWDQIRLKSGLVIIPLAFSLIRTEQTFRKRLLIAYCLILAAASFYCLAMAGWRYFHSGNLPVFFYHALVSPFSQHAVYFSIYVFTALVLLLENRRKSFFPCSPLLSASLIGWFSVFLFLLSSKLVIIFYLLYLFYYLLTALRSAGNRAAVVILFAIVIISSLVLGLHNPVSKRFNEIWNSDLEMVNRESFQKSDYLDGLQFRLLQWKFVPEIMDKTNAWWTGVSPGDAQVLLDSTYTAKNLYTGDPVKKTTGYLGYNTHNQFLEALLQTGIPGLFVFGLICFSLLRMAVRAGNRQSRLVILLLLVYSLIESVFETQYGILLFTFFPLFLYNYTGPTRRE